VSATTLRISTVQTRRVSAKRKGSVYIVAEAGVNHNGRLEAALQMVEAARHAGADAIKFQVFQADRLASRFAEQAAYQKKTGQAESQRQMLRELQLQPAEFARIKQHCDAVGIEFLATPFSVEDLRVLLDLGVRAIKIASPDIVNRPLLEAAGRSGLPIILSTGAAEPAEIDAAYRLLRDQHGCAVVLLHCVSSYPTPLEQANLRRMQALRDRCGCAVGFSDHTQEVQTGSLAVAAGAAMLEKHFTLDRSQPGPDHAFSLNPDQLTEYIHLARLAERILGDGALEPSESEREVRRLARCSVVAARDIPAGSVVSADMLAIKRPGTGIPPAELDAVAGCKVRQDIPADMPITWDMLEA